MLKPNLSQFSFQRLSKLFAPISGHQKIGLAVSGGADSVGLMLLVAHWCAQAENAPDVSVYCVDHGLRPESRAESELVAGMAQQLGFGFTGMIWDGEKPKTGLQAAARKARYALIGAAMKDDGVELLMTGHHAGDQAETVMMRMAHSSGLLGLSGMSEFSNVQDVEIFRPLLGVDARELHNLVLASGFASVDDPSNHNDKYERVRWRKALVPLDTLNLTQKSLGKFAHRMGRAEEALHEIASNLFAQHVRINQFGVASIVHDILLAQPLEIVIRLLSRMIVKANGGRSGGELAQVEDLAVALVSHRFDGKTLALCEIFADRGKLYVMREVDRISQVSTIVKSGGKTVWDQRFNIENGTGESLHIEPAVRLNRKEIEVILGQNFDGKMKTLAGAPMVKTDDGRVLGLGEMVFVPQLKICVLGGS